jgi:hypothetical protein
MSRSSRWAGEYNKLKSDAFNKDADEDCQDWEARGKIKKTVYRPESSPHISPR